MVLGWHVQRGEERQARRQRMQSWAGCSALLCGAGARQPGTGLQAPTYGQLPRALPLNMYATQQGALQQVESSAPT